MSKTEEKQGRIIHSARLLICRRVAKLRSVSIDNPHEPIADAWRRITYKGSSHGDLLPF